MLRPMQKASTVLGNQRFALPVAKALFVQDEAKKKAAVMMFTSPAEVR